MKKKHKIFYTRGGKKSKSFSPKKTPCLLFNIQQALWKPEDLASEANGGIGGGGKREYHLLKSYDYDIIYCSAPCLLQFMFPIAENLF